MASQLSKACKHIDRASCSKDMTDLNSMASKSLVKAGSNSKSRLKKRSQTNNVAVDSSTYNTKTVPKIQDGTLIGKINRNLQGGTSCTKQF